LLLDARGLDPNAVIETDVCIAGAGAAGITLARELRSSGLDVVVLESGDLVLDTPTHDLNGGFVDGLDYPLSQTRLRYFGGTTNHWRGWCRPLDPEDFEVRAWIPRSGWPFSRDHLAPYYAPAQSICQIERLDFDADSISLQLGRALLPFDRQRIQTTVYLLSPPTRFGRVYRDDLAGAATVTAYLNANLVNIRLAPMSDAVQSFECATLSGVTFSVVASRYVLALGGIENARVLLASNGQEPAGVGNRNDLVGRFFMEHPHYIWPRNGAFILTSGIADLAFYTTTWLLNGVRSLAVLRLAPELRAQEGLAALGVTLREATFAEATDSMGKFDGERLRGLVRFGTPRLLLASVRAEQRPLPDSRVTLSSERDRLGMPRVNLHWQMSPADVAGIRRTLELMADDFGRLGLGRLWMPLGGDGEFGTEQVEGGFHHMGTTRMSTSPADGVVDANCRVHGVANLYIAGSSVFPTTGFANPTLTIVALALRLAEHLRGTM
jgi:choline dehydrogenase-like flavoprotein